MRKATHVHITETPAQQSPAELLNCPEPLGNIDIRNGVYLPDLDDSATYALRLVGDCLAPVACDGEHAIINPNKPAEPGDYVALIFADGRRPMVKLLLVPSALPLGARAAGGDLAGIVMVEMLNPRRIIRLRSTELSAMHRVIGFLKRDGNVTDVTWGAAQ